MAMFSEENSITAPGTNIYSTNWEQLDSAQPISLSGTSMAAPTVSGVLGLVQEAYPYLSAKQLTDVGLSTTSQITYDSAKPFWTRLIGTGYGNFPEVKIAGINLFSTENLTRPTTEAGWKTLIMQAADITEDKLAEWCQKLKIMDDTGNLIYENIYFYNNVPETAFCV
jgi:subtilisin family serine protease